MKSQETNKPQYYYLNSYAEVAAKMMPQNFIGVLGRASAKTTQFQALRIRQAVEECPGAPFVWVADTYANLHKNVLPSVLEGLRFIGWERGEKFVIDRQPPEEWQQQMCNVFESFKQVMTFYNGFTFTFVSLDRPSIGAGRSYVGLFGDEVKYWPEEKFTNIRKAVRGYRARYGASPWYRSLSLTTDMPNPNHPGEYTWVMRLVKLMDRDRIKELLKASEDYNEAKKRYARELQAEAQRKENAAEGQDEASDMSLPSPLSPLPSEKPAKKTPLELASLNMERKRVKWVEKRQGVTFFLVASTLINADVLGEEFFREELQAGLEGIDTNLLSIPQKLEAAQLFYTTLTSRDFYEDGLRHEVIEQHEYGWEEDCSTLRYLMGDRPIEAGMDDGNMKSMVFGQQQGREYRVLKEIYTLPPDNERQLADEFIRYFKPHKYKLLKLYHDRAMNNYQRQGNDMAQRIKLAIEQQADGTPTGWRVQLMSRGQGNIGSHQEYNFFSALFARQLSRKLFTLHIDGQTCRNLRMEMESCPIVVAEDKRTGRKEVRKQKKGDKLPTARLPMESTNLTDALKYLIMRPDWVNIWKNVGNIVAADPK